MVTVYSHSRLESFEWCSESYKIKYVDKLFPKVPRSMELFLGDLVHQSLEWLYHVAPDRPIELDELLQHFAKNWAASFDESIRIRSGVAQDYFDKGTAFLANYYLTHTPFKEDTVSIEEEVRFALDDTEQYFVRRYIDRLVKAPDGSYEVHDYKTSKRAKTQSQADADQQLAFYHLGLQAKFGKPVQAKLIWHFLAENKQVVSFRTQEQLMLLKQTTLQKINRIETNEVWNACGKPWCDWCAWKLANPDDAQEICVKANLVPNTQKAFNSTSFRNSNLNKYFID